MFFFVVFVVLILTLKPRIRQLGKYSPHSEGQVFSGSLIKESLHYLGISCTLKVQFIVYSWLIYPRVIGHIYVGSLFCLTDLCICFCARTILFWSLQFYSIEWRWLLQLCSYFSRLFWLLQVFSVSIQILILFVLVLWKKCHWYFDRDHTESGDYIG